MTNSGSPMKDELDVVTEDNVAVELYNNSDVMDVTRDALWVESDKGIPCMDWGFFKTPNADPESPRYGKKFTVVCPPGHKKFWEEWCKNNKRKDITLTVQPTVFHVSRTEGELLEGYDTDNVLAVILQFCKIPLTYVDKKRNRHHAVRTGLESVISLPVPVAPVAASPTVTMKFADDKPRKEK